MVLIAAAFIAGCVRTSSPTESVPPANSGPSASVVPNETEGAVAMSFVSADPPPGSRIAGCGANMGGCAGKIRMRFTAVSPGTGFVQDVSAYLYGTEKRIACLYSNDLTSGPVELRAGVPQSFEAIFDRFDDCPTPETIRAVNLILSGDVATGSRQGWLLEYLLEP